MFNPSSFGGTSGSSRASQAPEIKSPISVHLSPISPLEGSEPAFSQSSCEQSWATDFAPSFTEEESARGLQDKKELPKDKNTVLGTRAPPTGSFRPIQQPNKGFYGEANTAWNMIGARVSGSPTHGSEMEKSPNIGSSDLFGICGRMDKLEATCKALTKENSILRAQIAECMGFRTSIHALAYRLDAMTIRSMSPSPYSGLLLPHPSSSQVNQVRSSHPQDAGAGRHPVMIEESSVYDMSTSITRNTRSVPPRPPHLAHKVYSSAEWSQSEADETLRAEQPPQSTFGPHRWLFVSRFKRNVTADHISDYIARKLSSKRRPICISLTRPEEPPNKVASFRVKLLPEDMEEALSPGFWDSGVLVKECKFYPPKKNYSRTSKDHQWN